MLVTNIELIPGKRITHHLGMVQGNTVRAKHVGRDLMANVKNLFGGELKGYTELLQEARDQATDRMCEQARTIGANAVINVRYSTSSITAGAAELFAYGTAVRLEDE
ncbi:MAG: YbjQ family protein [Pseudomonadota bacterium]|nr:YbjQ family protein [Pseudomonadota bacterium]